MERVGLVLVLVLERGREERAEEEEECLGSVPLWARWRVG